MTKVQKRSVCGEVVQARRHMRLCLEVLSDGLRAARADEMRAAEAGRM